MATPEDMRANAEFIRLADEVCVTFQPLDLFEYNKMIL